MLRTFTNHCSKNRLRMLCHSTTNPPPLVNLTNHTGPCLSFHSCRVVTTSHSSSSPSDNNTNNNNNNSTVSQYYANRVQHLNTLLQNQSLKHPNHMTMYPNKFEISRTLEQYVNEYTNTSTVEPGQKLMHITEKISGRILSVRKASNKLLFATVRNGDATFTVQIMMTKQAYGSNEEFDIMVQTLKRGDHIGIVGHPCKTGTGELSILPTQIVILSPCLHVLPDSFSSTSLLDPEVRYRNRALDFVVHHDTLVPHFQTRSNVLTFFRIFLQSRDFVEVETPILSLQSGGAAARPFITQLNSMGGDVELKLRIAPELYLKELVIGGMERVFELGKVFRNEGVDATHNPEFTSCELYMAHADYNDIMRFTEDLFRGCALFLHELKSAKKVGSGVIQTALKIASGNSVHEDEKAGIIEYTVEAGSKVDAQVIHIDLTKPFKRISYLDSIEEEIGEKIPRGEALTSASTIQQLINACKRHRIDLDKGRVGDVAYLLDRLLSNLVEPKCIQPTFICDHPALISPLAKSHESDPTLTERFELFVAGRELCNAYTELNDPVEQRRRFEQQVQAKEDHGDVEAHEKDDNFCRSLEYGLPPTGGWGCGIDRLVMLLTNSWNIRDVLLFPMMKPKESAAAATTIESTTPSPSNQ